LGGFSSHTAELVRVLRACFRVIGRAAFRRGRARVRCHIYPGLFPGGPRSVVATFGVLAGIDQYATAAARTWMTAFGCGDWVRWRAAPFFVMQYLCGRLQAARSVSRTQDDVRWCRLGRNARLGALQLGSSYAVERVDRLRVQAGWERLANRQPKLHLGDESLHNELSAATKNGSDTCLLVCVVKSCFTLGTLGIARGGDQTA